MISKVSFPDYQLPGHQIALDTVLISMKSILHSVRLHVFVLCEINQRKCEGPNHL